jgi:glycerol-3-phosphate dehydrogenase
MNRERAMAAVEDGGTWDFIVIGGGATGLGVAVDAASRGTARYSWSRATSGRGRPAGAPSWCTAASATSSRGTWRWSSTPSRSVACSWPTRPTWSATSPSWSPTTSGGRGPFYGIGLKMYDLLAGKQGFGRSRVLSRERTLQLLPTLEPDGLNGGVIYYDGQFDDARLAINLARTAGEQGAAVLNYVRVTGLIKEAGRGGGRRPRPGPRGLERRRGDRGGRRGAGGARRRRRQRHGAVDRRRAPDGRPVGAPPDPPQPGRAPGAPPGLPPRRERHHGPEDR